MSNAKLNIIGFIDGRSPNGKKRRWNELIVSSVESKEHSELQVELRLVVGPPIDEHRRIVRILSAKSCKDLIEILSGLTRNVNITA